MRRTKRIDQNIDMDALVERAARLEEQEIRIFMETGQTDYQVFDKDGNLLPRKKRSLWEVARAHRIPIDDILPEPRFEDDAIK